MGRHRVDPDVAYQQKLAREREYRRAIKQERMAQGLCIRCGIRPQEPGVQQCTECHEKSKAAHHKRYERLKAAGLCRFCGNPPHKPGASTCERHAQAFNEFNSRQLEQNICIACKGPNYSGKMRCERCREERNEYAKEHRQKRVQASLCPRCGKPTDRQGHRCTECLERMRIAYKRRSWGLI